MKQYNSIVTKILCAIIVLSVITICSQCQITSDQQNVFKESVTINREAMAIHKSNVVMYSNYSEEILGISNVFFENIDSINWLLFVQSGGFKYGQDSKSVLLELSNPDDLHSVEKIMIKENNGKHIARLITKHKLQIQSVLSQVKDKHPGLEGLKVDEYYSRLENNIDSFENLTVAEALLKLSKITIQEKKLIRIILGNYEKLEKNTR